MSKLPGIMKNSSKSNPLLVNALISGGQTGVDRAALDFALKNEIPCGGFCPKGRKAEDGVILGKYPLVETASVAYPVRTRRNILASDGTLIITLDNFMDRGTILTRDICLESVKPCFIAAYPVENTRNEFRMWLLENQIHTLNVAGCRESAQPGIYAYAIKMMQILLLD